MQVHVLGLRQFIDTYNPALHVCVRLLELFIHQHHKKINLLPYEVHGKNKSGMTYFCTFYALCSNG